MRPHQALGYLTPLEFLRGLTALRALARLGQGSPAATSVASPPLTPTRPARHECANSKCVIYVLNEYSSSTPTPSMDYNYRVASRILQGDGPIRFGDFARAVDELFDDLLITRWREKRRPSFERPLLSDRGAQYEVTVATATADASAIEVEVSDLRLVVRFPGPVGAVEHTFDFAHPVECEAVSAKWNSGLLAIVLPKKRGRRVTVE